MALIPTAYQLKRALFYPRILYGRYRENSYPIFKRNYDPLDDTPYRRQTQEFIGEMMRNPDILHEVGARPEDDVIDVGAYGGQWAQAVSTLYPGARIHCFELSPGIAAEMQRRVADSPDILAYDFGLGASTRPEKISRRLLGSSTMNIKRSERFDMGQMRDVAEV